jgi:lipid-binding SYLF domain-containing protein
MKEHMTMKKSIIPVMILSGALLFFNFTSPVIAGDESSKVRDATEVMTDIMAIPEKSIPPSLLNNAYAVAVIPNVIKGGFVFGGRYGWGVLVVKTKERKWSAPAFVSIAAGSVGYQIGLQSIDVILVFKSKKSVDRIAKGKFTLGADASIAAGPVGRAASAGTDIRLEAEIYSYSRSRGLFAGVSLEGSALQMKDESNRLFYNKEVISAADIFENVNIKVPDVAKEFIKTMTKYTAK